MSINRKLGQWSRNYKRKRTATDALDDPRNPHWINPAPLREKFKNFKGGLRYAKKMEIREMV
jgi:hypothetical protein